MYRKPSPKQCEAQARRLEAMRRGRERASLAREPRGRMPELPDLRRTVAVTDYDTGQAITHRIDLHKCGRIDQYCALADGKAWMPRIGWSRVLSLLRKAYQRIPSPRSDFWW